MAEYLWELRRTRTVRGGPVCRVRHSPKARLFSAGFCAECGAPFVVVAGKGDRYCSPACNERSVRRWSKQRRKRKLRAGDRIHPRKVFERDDWTCRLCSKPVDRAAAVNTPLSPTLDHILPVSLGGAHDYSNVQCAHFICNVRKGATVDQLSFAA